MKKPQEGEAAEKTLVRANVNSIFRPGYESFEKRRQEVFWDEGLGKYHHPFCEASLI